MPKQEEMNKRFDEEIQKLEDIYYNSEGDGYDNLNNYLNSDKNILCRNFMYPESPYELCPDKVKSFLHSEISLAVAEREKEIVEMIENIKRQHTEDTEFMQRKNPFHDAYNIILDDIINLIKNNERRN